ncbi:D-lyxose/D-mannose family sugar isomerase [Treponema primitia]|uniref:D-lyxose/D-mannose family sugar isomerase n=1 Tax=Treponema primitia TaxID=88058 RepID=UPI000255505C|nr:D-lyxose/D-mannose family sugar isomerase [Treponema primitia]
MKRSELNKIIRESLAFVRGRGLEFPPFATWSPDDWRKIGEDERELVDNMLGWDISDFGGNFKKVGLTIFTYRNGNFNNKEKYPKPYAEKLLLVDEGQELPFHFHWSKMEDIINRGGGELVLHVYNSDEHEDFAKTDVVLTLDGKKITVPAGSAVRLLPGQSITLLPGQYHNWIAEKGKVMLFEVSTTNDDRVDNRFHSAKGRIPEIEEDVKPEYLIFNDYKDYVPFK